MEPAKAAAARAAVAACVRPGLTLALGTGSTAELAVRAIVERFPGTRFDCVASSRASETLAAALGLPVRPLRADDRFDLMLDGADEVDPRFALTKGGGGALFREKLLAHLAREVVILVDPSKLVAALGTKAPLPVEVVPFARPLLTHELGQEGFEVRLRTKAEGLAYVTDNGNEILDLVPPAPLADPAATATAIRSHLGVVETGIFVGVTHRVFVGHPDGTFEERRSAPVGG